VLSHMSAPAKLDILFFDLPGHGGAPPAEGFEMRDLVRSARRGIEAHRRRGPVLVAGVSLGGAIAVELAHETPHEVAAFAAMNSALRFGTPAGWAQLVRAVRSAGTAAFDPDGTRDGWFTRSFTAGEGRGTWQEFLEDLSAVEPGSYVACCEALAEYDGTDGARELVVPGLAVGGAADRATPCIAMRELAELSRRTRYAQLPGAHLAIVENAHAAGALLDAHIDAAV
jgi:3-oxoadipate enol-lactonase/4-carboxymuconolactone decarboxylase